MSDTQKIIDFMRYAEGLKTELRRSSKSNGTPESVAEHCWSLSLLLILIESKLSVRIDLLKTLKMAVIHDLVEIEAKDVSVLEHIANHDRRTQKKEQESQAMESIRNALGNDSDEIHALWMEFEEQKTVEAKVLKALDRIEGQLQFLNENVRVFTKEEQPVLDSLFESTNRLVKVDPVIQELYGLFFDDIKKRVTR
ncbi:MAG: HD domain-containing protein [bacterium]